MCEESATAENLRAATPYPVPGSAVDPITLKPVDEVANNADGPRTGGVCAIPSLWGRV